MLGEQICKYCGCTDLDCSQCIEKTGEPCYWVAPDVCSACEASFLDSSESEDSASSGNSMEATTILADETHEIVAITHPSINKNGILEEIPEVDVLLTTDNYKVEHIGAGYAIVCFLFKESQSHLIISKNDNMSAASRYYNKVKHEDNWGVPVVYPKSVEKIILLSEYEGILKGLKICKEMLAQGQLSHESISEKECHYKEVLESTMQ